MNIVTPICFGFIVATYYTGCTKLTPLNLWPLTNISIAWDVILERDAGYPSVDQCWTSLEATTCPTQPSWLMIFGDRLGKSGPPNFNLLAFLFDRSPRCFVKVTTANSGDDGFTEMTLTFMLYLDTLTSGLILEYSASEGDDESMGSLVLELQSGKPHARMYGEEDELASSVTSDVTLTPSTWTWVAVRWNGNTGVLSVQVGSVITEAATPSGDSSDQMGVGKGTIQLGKYVTHGAQTSFYGRLCCLTMFDSVVDIEKAESDLEKMANPTSWQSKIPVATGCSGVGSKSTSLLYLWPLSNTSFGYDVIHHAPPIAPDNYQCTRPSVGNSVTNQTVVYRDGSQLSYFDTTIRHAIFDTEDILLFQVFLKPEDPVEGVVWELRPDQSGAGFQSMTLTLVSGVPTVTFFDEFGQCGSAVNREAILPGVWTLVYLMIPKGPPKMVIMTVTESGVGLSASGPLTCTPTTNPVPTHAVLTVGSLSDVTLKAGARDVSFRGDMACLSILKETVDRALIYSNLLTQCVAFDNLHISENISQCDATPPIRERKFVRAATDKSPAQEYSLGCVQASSLIGCSNRCRDTPTCRAFTFRPIITECCVYDYVTRAGLHLDTGCSYYTVTRV